VTTSIFAGVQASSQTDIALAKSLNERRGEAFLVSRVPTPSAKPGGCHANVQEYVRTHPGTQPVRGWLVEEFEGFTYFSAHSVVRLQDGSLIDITITPLDRDYPFIPHTGTEEEFERLRDGRPRVQYPPIDVSALGWCAPVADDDADKC
jgi:hypothetical protein